MRFALDRRKAPEPELHLSVTLEGRTYEVTDEWFEDGLQRLDAALPDDVRLVCCVTCLYSDYSPKAHYLAVRSKAD